jgi:ribosomal protein S18 acetylase RimI-like enzyme
MTVALRGLDAADLPALSSLAPCWSEAALRSELYDAARGHGRQVVVAVRGRVISGCAGWVAATPCWFGAPVIALDPTAASALIAHVVERARQHGAERVRVSASDAEPVKREALVAAGFVPRLDMATVVRPASAAAAAPVALDRVPWAELDAAAWTASRNDSFVGVDNAPPESVDVIAEQLASPLTARDATAAWRDGLDRGYAALVRVERDVDDRGRFGAIAEIAVRPAWRGRGLAGAILDDALARLDDVVEVRALIASTNLASLALHAGRGFVERARRTVYEVVTRG